MKKLFWLAMITSFVAGLAGCPRKKTEESTTDKTPTAKVVEDKGTTPAPTPLPQECTDYKAAVAKAAACEKLGDQRAELQKQLDAAVAGWGKLDDAGRAGLKDVCKTSTESVTKTLTTACP
jgi:hypothetical protein